MKPNSVKIALLSGACLLLAVPAHGIEWSGYGEVRGGGGSYHTENMHLLVAKGNSEWSVAGSAHANMAFASGLNLQFDLEGKKDFFQLDYLYDYYAYNPENRDTASSYGFGIHLNGRWNDYRFGPLLSFGNAHWLTAGFEAARYFEKTTLFAQATYSADLKNDPYTANYWYLQTGGRYFPQDNLMFELGLGAGIIDAINEPSISAYTRTFDSASYTATSTYGGINGNMVLWSAKAEYRFEAMPISIGLDYQGSYATKRRLVMTRYDFDHTWGYSWHGGTKANRLENLFMLKLRYYLGTASLIAHDRDGASMNDYNPLYGVTAIPEADAGIIVVPVPA